MGVPAHKILVVDDDVDFLKQLTERLGAVYSISSCLSLERAREHLKEHLFDLLLLDLVFGNNADQADGIDLVAFVRTHYPALPIIAVTQYGSANNIIKAMSSGAKTVLLKDDWDALKWRAAIDAEIDKGEQLIELEKRAKFEVEQLKTSKKTIKENSDQSNEKETHPFLGNDKEIIKIKTELKALSEEPDVTVLLLGETGVGKEVAARYLHGHGVRKKKAFRAVNMVAISKELIESELFGHKKGSFTGATTDKDGVFAEADGGVLFLDEIGEISPLLQQKLLRFLQEKVITPVGGKERIIDVQIIAATNRNLREEVQQGAFREDLYHRLNDYVIKIPPLRERKDDIETIALHYLKSRGAEKECFDDDVWCKLREYEWPGNIRELRNIIRRLLLKRRISETQVLDPTFLPEEFSAPKSKGEEQVVESDAQKAFDPKTMTDLQERTAYNELKAIEAALKELKLKQKVVEHLKFKNLDQLRYRVVNKYYSEYPHLFNFFPIICKKFKVVPHG